MIGGVGRRVGAGLAILTLAVACVFAAEPEPYSMTESWSEPGLGG